MKISTRRENNVLIYHLKGDITTGHLRDFEDQVKHDLKHHEHRFLVEMDGMNDIDESGYQTLGSCLAAAHAKGANFVLYFHDEKKLEQFNNSPYAEFFVIATDAQTAKRELHKPRKKK